MTLFITPYYTQLKKARWWSTDDLFALLSAIWGIACWKDDFTFNIKISKISFIFKDNSKFTTTLFKLMINSFYI